MNKKRGLFYRITTFLPGICILAAIILAACDGTGSYLSQAESLLETNPAAADSILSSMPEPQSRRDRAWYAVLKTQADYKLYKPITSDSLILTATDYYGTHRKNYRSAMAWYSQGCVYLEMNDDVAATESYLRAIDLFPDTLNRFFILSEKSIGDVYCKKTMHDQALAMYSSCLNNASLANDSAIIAYCKFRIATIYLYENKYDIAAALFTELLDNPYLSSFYRNETKINYGKIMLYGFNDLQTAYGLFTRYQKESKKDNGLVLSILGVIHYRMCNYDSAQYYFKKSLESVNEIYTRSINYSYLIDLSSMMGDTESARYYSRKYSVAMDSILVIENANDVASVKIQYAQESYQFRRREYLVRTIIVSVSLLIVLVLWIAIVYQRRIRKNQEYYIALSDNYRHKQITLKSNSSESEILDYCLKLFSTTPSYDIMKRGESTITHPLRQSILHDLTVSFSEYYSFAHVQYPDFNTNYINYCILNYLDFTHQQIIDILCMSENNYRVTKSRIRKILEKDNRLYPK